MLPGVHDLLLLQQPWEGLRVEHPEGQTYAEHKAEKAIDNIAITVLVSNTTVKATILWDLRMYKYSGQMINIHVKIPLFQKVVLFQFCLK